MRKLFTEYGKKLDEGRYKLDRNGALLYCYENHGMDPKTIKAVLWAIATNRFVEAKPSSDPMTAPGHMPRWRVAIYDEVVGS